MPQHWVRTFHRYVLAGFFLLILLPLPRAVSAEVNVKFEEANRLYEQGKYDEAASTYESIVKSRGGSAALYFNLGNTYFKNGQLGRALFHYRMAERMAPRDPDIEANLRLTRERVAGASTASSSTWDRFLGYFTLNELSAFCAVLFWIWAGLYILIRWRPSLERKLRGLGLATGSILAASVILVCLSFIASRSTIAIVLKPDTTVHLGPLVESQPAFTSGDGVELDLMARREDWVQVRDHSNRSGWIAATNVLIFPPNR